MTAKQRLRCDLNMLTLAGLPDFSAAPKRSGAELYRAIRAAGYEGVQAGDVELCRQAGLRTTGHARVDSVEDAFRAAREGKEAGHDCVTIHAGTGLEDDSAQDKLAHAIVGASEELRIPLYLETHRATITQDIWRTVRLVERVPGLRFNGDFSHWYTGHEMTYGDFVAKLDFMEPVFQRVRFMHGRIGNSGSMQVGVGDAVTGANVNHFREIWTRVFNAFFNRAEDADVFIFTPELLRPGINYARTFRDRDGVMREESDRWEEALKLCAIARECFEEATTKC
ncbi:MAG: hypothetical protein ABI579_04835 [Candidatus Sumerlaeota bacterium]